MSINLSPNQLTLFNAVSKSKHSKAAIARKAGIGRNLLWMHITGRHEPTEAIFNAEMQAINELANSEMSDRGYL